MHLLEENKVMRRPKAGRLLYNQYVDDSGQIVREVLFFIDSPPDNQNQWWVTYVAQMEDYGEGLEVDFHPVAGAMSAKMTRIARDEDIKKFTEALLTCKKGDKKLEEWAELIKTHCDLEPLLPREKDRLLTIISQALRQVPSE